MKLVAAKCPNCGAQIEVDKNSDSTVCDYCNSKIIVEDAIEKYKVEISGSIEVENLPKLENFLKLADRCFAEKDYNEAYNYYSKVIELDPDNVNALVKKGMCKAQGFDYELFDIEPMTKGLKYACEILKKQNDLESINSYVKECYDIVKVYDKMLVDKYKRRDLTESETIPFNGKILKCVNAYEVLNQFVDSKPLKIEILKSLILEIDNLKLNKEYRTYMDGRSVIRSTCHSQSYKNKLEEAKRKYTNELSMLLGPNQSVGQQINHGSTKEKELFLNFIPMSNDSMNAIRYFCVGICGLLALSSLINLNFVSLILFVVVGVLTLPQICSVMLKGKKNRDKGIILCIKVFLFIAACFMLVSFKSDSSDFEEKQSVDNSMSVELRYEKANIKLEEARN